MYALGQWLAIVLLLVTAGNTYLRGLAFSAPMVKEIARFSLVAGIASGISYLNYRADILLVKQLDHPDNVGTYSLAARRTINRKLLQLPALRRPASQPLRIVALTRKPVLVDGLIANR